MGWSIPYHHGKFREGTAYRKNVNHQKKPKEWTDRNCWREIRGDRNSNPRWYSGRRKKQIIKFDHRRHRRYSKKICKNGDWERLHDRDWFWFNNPWNWD